MAPSLASRRRLWWAAEPAELWKKRLLPLEDTDPIPYRRQNGGDYEIPSARLREGLETPGRSGFGLHIDA